MILCQTILKISSGTQPPRPPASKFAFRLNTPASSIFLHLC